MNVVNREHINRRNWKLFCHGQPLRRGTRGNKASKQKTDTQIGRRRQCENPKAREGEKVNVKQWQCQRRA